jgi:hypothetical protein
VAAGGHVDEEIVREVVRLGFTREYVMESIKARQQNKVGEEDGGGGASLGCTRACQSGGCGCGMLRLMGE